jgi:hypothetical protein
MSRRSSIRVVVIFACRQAMHAELNPSQSEHYCDLTMAISAGGTPFIPAVYRQRFFCALPYVSQRTDADREGRAEFVVLGAELSCACARS